MPGRRPDLLTPRLAAGHRDLPEPEAAGGYLVDIEAPAELSEGGLAIWETVVPDLLNAKILQPADLPLLVEFCESMGMTRTYRQRVYDSQAAFELAITEGPADGEDPKDYADRLDVLDLMVKRARASYVQTLKLALSLASEFGISPTSRVRLGLAKVQGASLLDAIKRRRGGDAG